MKTTYSSTLPNELIEQLNEYARKLNIPKNQLIERSIRHYIQKIKQAEYIQSFQRAAQDEEQTELAEAGLEEFLEQVEQL
ncbi:MAG: ribbon-helix-helix protein, CopG family [Phaeodactylibacter sp.]|nr:ribbon-helix-helix protein, CopG family [Phaeodactylibacter sp.]MCB9296652.1 ribbon-helix-helix protein, CopG family [Lewinellaceae bacterium]MCO6491518.1 ribbon-helix-helix protein, CopG family [Phaeodactylibacter sp.]